MENAATRLQDAWRTFSTAPHRMFFFTGMWQLVAVSAWWAIVLAARALDIANLEPVLPALFVHGGMMLFLVFTPFMAGFLFTVFPRWQPAPEIPRGVHLFVFAGMNLGQLGFLIGMYTSAGILAAALGVLVAAWTALLVGLGQSLLRASQRAPHAVTVLAGLAGGYAGLVLFLHAVLAGDFQAWAVIRALGVWAFLVPVYFSVSHRMVPFFTSRVLPGYRVYRPDTLLYAAIALCVARALLEFLPAWRWLASVPLGLIFAWLVWNWWPRQKSEHALMRVLHLSLFWLAGGVLLFGAQDLLQAFGRDFLGRVPLHALGIGFFGGMLLSMVTRVSLGHSGRPLVLDRFTWLIFWLVQASVIVRIAGEFLPAVSYAGYRHAMACAALIWMSAFFAWAWKFIRIYWQPRVDGAPG